MTVSHAGQASATHHAVDHAIDRATPDRHAWAGPSPISQSMNVHRAEPLLPVVAARAAADIRHRITDTDLSVHPLALGCGAFGWTVDGPSSRRILDVHRDLGGNFLDTADSYAGGCSELFIGSWLSTSGMRDQTVIATKIGRNSDNPGLSPSSIAGAVDASLERLGTDYIDLLYFHYDEDVPLEESLGAVDALIRSGKVRYLGACDFAAERLMEARVLAANGLPRFVALETPYNLLHRAAFESCLELVTAAQGLSVMPHSALAHGFLAGACRTKWPAAGSARRVRAAGYLTHRGIRMLAALDRIAAEHSVPPATIALAWLLSRGGVAAPVAGASHPDQVAALLAAAGIRLTRHDLVELDRVSV